MSGAKKRTSLDAVFGSTDAPAAVTPERDDVRGLAPVGKTSPERGGRGEEAKRPHVKQHTAYLPLPVHEQLRKLAFEENRKIHELLIEGIDRVFANRGLPTVSDLS